MEVRIYTIMIYSKESKILREYDIKKIQCTPSKRDISRLIIVQTKMKMYINRNITPD